MASYLSKAKLPATSVADGISFVINQRGYAAAAASGEGRGGAAVLGKGGSTDQVAAATAGKAEEKAVISEESGGAASSWGPDPVTGYYRPGDQAAEIGTAELREMALNHKEDKAK